MKYVLAILAISILISGCADNKPKAEVAKEILTCSKRSTFYTPKCRVLTKTGKRLTVTAPVAVGDTLSTFQVLGGYSWEVENGG